MLRDLSVQNYRCFEDFKIDGLAGVNLFVGNNNTGKTSLLEAIYFLVSSSRRIAFYEIIRKRIDYFCPKETLIYDCRSLFYRRQTQNIIKIETCTEEYLPFSFLFENGKFGISNGVNQISYVITQSKFDISNSLKKDLLVHIYDPEETSDETQILKTLFISINKMDFNIVKLIWDTIHLTEKETKVISTLKIIEPDLDRIGFSSSPETEAIRLKLKNRDYPVPLSSMGEGMSRLLTIAMSLVTSEDGVLLVDEIETGLHYEAQTDMWRLILETAKELNVQVFATTHSWDCIAAFQEALSQVEDQSIGKLFRLDKKYGKLRAVEYDAEKLDTAVRNSIEVR